MSVLQALFLGLVQGLTEFLPVSSSGHLVLFQRLMNTDLGGADMLFDLTLHLGTLFSVCVAMRRQIVALFSRPFKKLIYLIVATIPAGLAGVFLGDLVDSIFFGGAYLAFGFAASAALLAAAQICARKRAGALPLKFSHAAWMGAAQAVAVIPGISRSGATVAAGIIAGGNREDVSAFSFLMSIPVIAGGFVVQLYKGFSDGTIAQALSFSSDNPALCVAVSVAASAAAGLFAIRVMQKCISSAKYTPFIVYLSLLALACGALKLYGVL